VSFQLFEGETLGLVGESGCGKTTLGRTILHLEKATKGHIFYKQKDVTNLSKKELKDFRKEVQIIFQDPFSSLNPRIPVGEALMEPMKVHGILNSSEERKKYVFELLQRVGLLAEHFYSGLALREPLSLNLSSLFATNRFRHSMFRCRRRY